MMIKLCLNQSEKKILIPLNMLEDKLDSFHKFSIDGIIESCHPMNIKALVTAFNNIHHFKGIIAEVKKILIVM